MKISVVRQLGGLGDALIMSCVYRGLKEKFPDAYIINVTSRKAYPGLAAIAEHNPFVDAVVTIEPNDAASEITKRWWNQFDDAANLADALIIRKSDMAYDLNVACIERECAEIKKYGTVTTPRYKIWCDAAGVVPSSYKPIYEITEGEQEHADRYWRAQWRDERVIGLGLASANPTLDGRSLALEQLRQIALGLRSRGFFVITIDQKLSLDGFPALVHIPIEQLMPLLKRMKAVISADSGLLHFAGAIDIPVVGIFGPTDPTMRMEHYRGTAITSNVPCAFCWYTKGCLKSLDQTEHIKCLRTFDLNAVVDAATNWGNQ